MALRAIGNTHLLCCGWSFRAIGQTERTANHVASKPCEVATQVGVLRGRQDYLGRLGISKGKNTPYRKTKDYIEKEDGDDEFSMNEKPEKPDKRSEMNAVDIKNQRDFRIDFLRKLSYKKVWVPNAHQSPKHQTVIIFDWDDTILCTSFLNSQHQNDESLSDAEVLCLQKIQTTVIKLLGLSNRLGQTFIITNAMDGWVEYSAAKWVPELLPILKNVRVISARTKYEPCFPGEVNKWKIQAFLDVQKQLDSQIITNLISLGDSNFEMDAVHVMGKEFAQALVKTIKFRENPSPSELLKQLELVTQKFEQIVENGRNLKIGLERKSAGGA